MNPDKYHSPDHHFFNFSAGSVVFSEYSSVHLHCSEVGPDHQLAMAGNTHNLSLHPFSSLSY